MQKLLVLMMMFAISAVQAQSAYKRFSGKITVVTDEALKYDSELLLLYNIDPKLRPVFETGLLYPALLRDADSHEKTVEIAHKVTVSEFKIVQSASAKIKTFHFVVLQPNGTVPKLFMLQLVNDAGTWKMDIATFLKECRVLKLQQLK